MKTDNTRFGKEHLFESQESNLRRRHVRTDFVCNVMSDIQLVCSNYPNLPTTSPLYRAVALPWRLISSETTFVTGRPNNAVATTTDLIKVCREKNRNSFVANSRKLRRSSRRRFQMKYELQARSFIGKKDIHFLHEIRDSTFLSSLSRAC